MRAPQQNHKVLSRSVVTGPQTSTCDGQNSIHLMDQNSIKLHTYKLCVMGKSYKHQMGHSSFI